MKEYSYLAGICCTVLTATAVAQTLPSEFEGSWRNPQNGHSQLWRVKLEDQQSPSALLGKIIWYGFGGYCTTPKEGMPFSGSYDGEKLIIYAPLLNPNTKCGKLSIEMKRKEGEDNFTGNFANDWPVSGTVELRVKK